MQFHTFLQWLSRLGYVLRRCWGKFELAVILLRSPAWQANPKIAMAKIVLLISAKWHEFLRDNPNADDALDEDDRPVRQSRVAPSAASAASSSKDNGRCPRLPGTGLLGVLLYGTWKASPISVSSVLSCPCV